MIKVGGTVRFARMPDWVSQMPEETQRVFELCLGHSYRVVDIDQNGHFMLDVSAEADPLFGGFGNAILLEREYLEEVEPS
jgi:hypothetical protein